MKDLLRQAVQALINEDIKTARELYAQYFSEKSKFILEDMNKNDNKDIVHGHCGGCGEDSTTTQKILDAKKWQCGKCDSKTFETKKNHPISKQ